MAVPKRRKSKSKVRSRRAAQKVMVPQSKPCANCGAAQLPHRLCTACGYYRGRQVITVEAD
ncbi:MAG: 50S ribosomal protein L32 [Lentisphaerae bacterium]|nr:50S ribosomal protein L32 [Lentisphaerota bacterium]